MTKIAQMILKVKFYELLPKNDEPSLSFPLFKYYICDYVLI